MLKITKIKKDRKVPVYDVTVPITSSFYANDLVVHNCSEIALATGVDRTAVCFLSSANLEKFDTWKGTSLIRDVIIMLDNVIQDFIERAPPELAKAVLSVTRERAIGLGTMGFHSYLQSKMIPFESEAARKINKEMFAYIKSEAEAASLYLGATRGEAPDMRGTGRRNSHLLAVAPNANSAILLGTSPSVEPIAANAYTHQTRAGSWPVKNKYLEALLERKNKNTDDVWNDILSTRGSVQHLDFLSEHEKAVFKTAYEIDQTWVIQHAADRQPFICQAQSINLFFPPRVDRAYFNRVHMMAWRKGLKSLYYTRTSSKNSGDNVENKLVRQALKNGDEVKIESTKVETTVTTEILTISANPDECISCQG